MSQPVNSIISTTSGEQTKATNLDKIATQCKEFLSSPLEPEASDLSYTNAVSKDENLKFICTAAPVTLKEIDNSFTNHDIKCEFLLIRYITDDDKHRKKLMTFKNPTINKLNRFTNVIPYESNSVPVSKEVKGRDANNYINASFVTGPMGIKFIAAQNPMENTLNSFWLMIINHKVSLVILFSYTFEESNDKYIQYWPKETNTPITITGLNNVKYTIKLTSQMDVIEKYVVVRYLEVYLDNQVIHTITHYHVNCWEEHSIPLQQIGFQVLEDLIWKVEEHKHSPVLIHCSDGIGRTGTFISLFNIIKCLHAQKEANEESPMLNIFNVVRKLREERYGMVTDFVQYKYIYDFCKIWMNRFYEVETSEEKEKKKKLEEEKKRKEEENQKKD